MTEIRTTYEMVFFWNEYGTVLLLCICATTQINKTKCLRNPLTETRVTVMLGYVRRD